MEAVRGRGATTRARQRHIRRRRACETRSRSLIDDPDLAGNPVARAHARAAHRGPTSARSHRRPLLEVVALLVIVPAIVLLVSNPAGWVLLFMLCLGFGYLFAFGGIL
jgi:hypothetical protein